MQIDITQIDITQIVIALIGLITAIVTGAIVPVIKQWFNTKVTAEQQYIIQTICTSAVYAAQQLFTSSEAKEKKAYALKQAEQYLAEHNIKISESEISTYIEGALKDIKTSLGEDVKW